MRGRSRGSIAICARLSIWKTPTVSPRQITVERRLVVRRNRRHRQLDAAVLPEEPEGEVEMGERAEAEQVHLEEADGLDVVLVPLDDGALGHAAVLDRHQVADRLVAEQEAAGMDREVAREVVDLGAQAQQVLVVGAVRIEPGRAQDFGARVLVVADQLRQPVERGGREPERLADVAHRRTRPVADDVRDHRGVAAPVLRVDVLDHFLAPLVHRCRGRCRAARRARARGSARTAARSATGRRR